VRLSWAQLLKRVFDIDIAQCPGYGEPTRIITFVTEVGSVQRILGYLGEPHAKALTLP